MNKNFVLDTSALLTYILEEKGCDQVEAFLDGARKGKQVIYISFMSLMEIYYLTRQKHGENDAKELIALIKSLPLDRIESYTRLTLLARRIKAGYKLSVADAFIAATAIEKEAVLVHKDPEFEALEKFLRMIELPYKIPRN